MPRWLAALVVIICLQAARSADSPATVAQIGELRATDVSLHAKNATPLEAFSELGREAHVQWQSNIPSLWTRPDLVTLDLDHFPYWQAMQELSTATGIMPLGFENGKVTLLQDTVGWSARPAVVCGPFRISVNEYQVNRTVSLGREPVVTLQQTLVLDLEVEPAIKPAFVVVKFNEAQDQDGGKIRLMSSNAIRNIPFLRNYADTFLNLDVPPTAKKLSRLSLEYDVSTVEASTPFETDLPGEGAKADAKTVGGLAITAHNVPAGGAWTIRIEIDNKSLDQQQWQHTLAALRVDRPHVFDADGQELENHGGGYGPRGQESYGFNFTYGQPRLRPARPAGRPQKLSWDIPTRLLDTHVPVTFENLPLREGNGGRP